MPKSPFEPLVRDGALTREALAAAVRSAAAKQMSVGWILVNENRIPLEAVGRSLAAHFRVPFEPFREDLKLLPDAVERLKPELLPFTGVAPVAREKDRLVLLMSDPGDLPLRDRLEALLGEPFTVRVALKEDILRLVTGRAPEPYSPPPDLGSMEAEEPVDPLTLSAHIDSADSGVVSMLNMILAKSLQEKAEEIRIDPRETPPGAWRIGGEWRDLLLPESMLQFMVRRLKVMANLDIGTRARAQQGFFELLMSRARLRFDVSIEPVGGGDEAARIVPGKR